MKQSARARHALPLQSTQKLLWRLITAPEGVHKALKQAPASLPILGDERVSKEERLDIYANMYFYRILDCLKEDFPRVLVLIGPDRFHNLVTDYLIRHMPTHWSLRYAGQYLPRFLKNYNPVKKQWPYLADLAHFEYALLESFDAVDATPLSDAALASLTPDRWSDLRLSFVPSFQRLSLQWRVDRRPFKAGKNTLLVWRKGLKVYHRPAGALEGILLSSIQKGCSFEELCELASKKVGAEKAGPALTALLRQWVGEGIFKNLPWPVQS